MVCCAASCGKRTTVLFSEGHGLGGQPGRLATKEHQRMGRGQGGEGQPGWSYARFPHCQAVPAPVSCSSCLPRRSEEGPRAHTAQDQSRLRGLGTFISSKCSRPFPSARERERRAQGRRDTALTPHTSPAAHCRQTLLASPARGALI